MKRSARPWQPAESVRIAIISCIERETERVRTLAQFHAIGLKPVFEPYLNECSCPENTGAHHGRVWFEKALRDFLDTDEPGLVIAEDDIDVLPAFRPALELTVMTDEFTDFCIWRERHHPKPLAPLIKERRPIPPDLYVLEVPKAWYGTQCVYIPRWAVLKYFEHPDLQERRSAFDSNFALLIRREGMVVLGAYPNPVQHRSPHSIAELVRGNGSRGLRQSDSFGLVPTRSWRSRLVARGVEVTGDYGEDVRSDGLGVERSDEFGLGARVRAAGVAGQAERR